MVTSDSVHFFKVIAPFGTNPNNLVCCVTCYSFINILFVILCFLTSYCYSKFNGFFYCVCFRIFLLLFLKHGSNRIIRRLSHCTISDESDRLDYYRKHQTELRVDLYSGISDAITRGETDPSSIGRRVILPSSFTGGARYMIQNYQDAMTLCV